MLGVTSASSEVQTLRVLLQHARATQRFLQSSVLLASRTPTKSMMNTFATQDTVPGLPSFGISEPLKLFELVLVAHEVQGLQYGFTRCRGDNLNMDMVV